MLQLKYTALCCNFTNSGERIRDQFIKGNNNQKYQEELLKVASDNTPLDQLAKVVCELEAVKLSTNALQNSSTQVDTANKNSRTKPMWKRCQPWGKPWQRQEVTGLIQCQQMEHAATMVPSVKRDSILPMGKLARIVTRITLLTYVDNAKGRGLLALTVTMVHSSRVETNIQKTSETTMVARATVTATEATGVATSQAETLMKHKLMISYRTSSKNEAATTPMMIILTPRA